jgi:hypothetical protein
MTLINICSHERLEVFPDDKLTLVVYSNHNPQAAVIRLDGIATIRQTSCQPEEDNGSNRNR